MSNPPLRSRPSPKSRETESQSPVPTPGAATVLELDSQLPASLAQGLGLDGGDLVQFASGTQHGEGLARRRSLDKAGKRGGVKWRGGARGAT